MGILGQIHWSNIVRLVTISPNSSEWPREYFVTTTIAFITMFDLLFSVIMLVSIKKQKLMGYVPWIIFRGIIAFALLMCGVIFTINQLKGDLLDSPSLNLDEENSLNLGIESTSLSDFGLTNMLLLWFLILFIGWVIVVRDFKKESVKSIQKENLLGKENKSICNCASLIVELEKENYPFT